MLKDFNIADEAGGAGKEVIKSFTAVVTSNTMDIRFYWAAKGTTALPDRGVYGPLISAISVNNPGMLHAIVIFLIIPSFNCIYNCLIYYQLLIKSTIAKGSN